MGNVALLDGDVFVYRAGFAAEHTFYDVFSSEADDVVKTLQASKEPGEGKKGALEYMAGFEEGTVELRARQEVEPLDFCLFTVKQMINAAIKQTTADRHLMFLSPSKTFRDDVATIQPYKGNRADARKPQHYDDIKKYLKERWGATTPDNIEADDAISLMMWREINLRKEEDRKGVVVSIDKDLNQIPGKHYNFVTEEFYYVTEEDGERYFFEQCLSGDATDHIRGAKGIGAARAKKILAEHSTPEAYWKEIVKYYDTEDEAVETARLVYMLRESPHERWEPPCSLG